VFAFWSAALCELVALGFEVVLWFVVLWSVVVVGCWLLCAFGLLLEDDWLDDASAMAMPTANTITTARINARVLIRIHSPAWNWCSIWDGMMENADAPPELLPFTDGAKIES
jgi:hypothetical protein